jgi:hypothetical protein
MPDMKSIIRCFFFLFFLYAPVSASSSDFPASVTQPIQESISVRQKTQKAEDQWALEKTKLQSAYNALKNEQARLLDVQAELTRQVSARESAVASLESKIDDISRISTELAPYLKETFLRLARLVEDDPPFLMQERKERMDKLHTLLEDVQVSTSEKFRKIMEALFIEAEYGNTVEVYQERILIEGKDILVNVFRLGRVSLFFQSLDTTSTGYYNQAQAAWMFLPERFNREVNAAVDIGMKRRSVDILNLPIGRITPK